MTTNAVFVIVFALLQGAAAPAQSSTAGRIPQPPPVFSPAPPAKAVCPLSFCDDFQDVCESSGAPESTCEDNVKLCTVAPCDACDEVAAACNKTGGAHCNEIVDKCRVELVGCCMTTVIAECPSTEALQSYTGQFCVDHPFGRSFECSTAPPSAALCEITIAKVEGCDITLCDYKACAAALLTADCDETPPECEAIAACT